MVYIIKVNNKSYKCTGYKMFDVVFPNIATDIPKQDNQNLSSLADVGFFALGAVATLGIGLAKAHSDISWESSSCSQTKKITILRLNRDDNETPVYILKESDERWLVEAMSKASRISHDTDDSYYVRSWKTFERNATGDVKLFLNAFGFYSTNREEDREITPNIALD